MAQMKTNPPRDMNLGCIALPPALVPGNECLRSYRAPTMLTSLVALTLTSAVRELLD